MTNSGPSYQEGCGVRNFFRYNDPMKIPVSVAVVDDTEFHRSDLRICIDKLGQENPCFEFHVEAEFENGQELIDHIDTLDVHLVTLDLRMPTLDGMTTLMMLRRTGRYQGPLVICSSEDETTVLEGVNQTSQQVENYSNEKKFELLKRIEERILSGETQSSKVNDLLTGCGVLQMDPWDYALHLGANAFIHKPFSYERMARILPEVVNGKTFERSKDQEATVRYRVSKSISK